MRIFYEDSLDINDFPYFAWKDHLQEMYQQPVDICKDCWYMIEVEASYLVTDHPDYEDDHYICAMCGERLTTNDNEWTQ